jgi:hypothetical protein
MRKALFIGGEDGAEMAGEFDCFNVSCIVELMQR